MVRFSERTTQGTADKEEESKNLVGCLVIKQCVCGLQKVNREIQQLTKYTMFANLDMSQFILALAFVYRYNKRSICEKL